MRREQREKMAAMDENPITITVTQGSTAVLPCSVDPRYTEQHKDQYRVVWVSPQLTAISIEDRRMINDMRISVERPFLRDWNLHIRNVSVTDSGEFMCQLNTVPVKSKKVNLLVNVPPMITDYTQPVELTRMEGELVELFCNATGVPPPTVTWYRKNRYTRGGEERVGSNGEHLVIHNVTRMCADIYICSADNNVPPASKQEFIVDVNYPPEIKLHNARIGQAVGKETILECIISASPLHVSLWKKGKKTFGNNHEMDDRHEVIVYEHSSEPNTIVLSLRIMRVEPEDFGMYTCEAKNNFGEVFKHMELYEVRPKPPPTTTPPTTIATTTTRRNDWLNSGGQSNNIHQHGTGNRYKKPGQPGNYNGGEHLPPDVIVNNQESANRNGGYAGSGIYRSTARPSGQLGSEGSYKGGIYDPDAREVYDENGSGISSVRQSPQCILVLLLCLMSSLLWTSYQTKSV